MATILYFGTAGSDDPTRAGLPFNFAMGRSMPATGPRSSWPARRST
jgi:hypothetical protein